MKCSEVSLLLSEYVDDDLDPINKGIVEEHLTACTACAAELHFLQAYLRAMAGMEKVGAPANFLAAVHERIEHPSALGRLVKWLFYPLKIKVPMELAGIALAAVLLVFTYQAPRQEKAQSLPAVSGEVRQSPLPADMKGAAQDKAAIGRLASAPRRIELALHLPAPQMAEREAMPRPLSAAPPPEGKLESDRRKARENITRQPSSPLESAPAALINAPRKDASLAPLDSYRAYELIRASVAGLGGAVLSTSPRPETNEPRTILIQIPARSYLQFLESVNREGLLEKLPEKPAATKETAEQNELLEIQIELIPPE